MMTSVYRRHPVREGSRNVALSVVVPLHNEEESLGPLYGKIRDTCDALDTPYEVIFVDDGSGDRTFERLEALHDRDRRVKVVRFRRNYGQTAAMAAGFARARGHTVVSMDGDLQNDPADIPRLLQKLEEGYDAVCGWRKERRDRLISRRIPSAAANWLLRKITGVPIHDSGCSLRAYRGDVIKRVALYGDLHRLIPAMSLLTGARITEIVVTHHPRRYGQSKYGISRVFKVVSDLLTVRMLLGFASRPALGFGLLGLPFTLVALLVMIWIAIAPVEGITLPATAFLCFALVGHLMLTGFLGELVLLTAESPPDQMPAPETIQQG